MLRRLWRRFRNPLGNGKPDSRDALKRAWIRDQILEARIAVLEKNVQETVDDSEHE